MKAEAAAKKARKARKDKGVKRGKRTSIVGASKTLKAKNVRDYAHSLGVRISKDAVTEYAKIPTVSAMKPPIKAAATAVKQIGRKTITYAIAKNVK